MSVRVSSGMPSLEDGLAVFAARDLAGAHAAFATRAR
jgi:hypothetical protein